MKKLLFLILIIFFGCTPTKKCAHFNNYIKKVYNSNSYWIESKYCIKKVRKPVQQNGVLVNFNLFNRLTGEPLQVGVLWVNGSIDYTVEGGSYTLKLDNGVYSFEIVPISGLPLKIKNLKLQNSSITIDCFIGNTQQF